MTRFEYEEALLMELEGLDKLNKLFGAFNEMLDGGLVEFGDYLDEDLNDCLSLVLTICKMVHEDDIQRSGQGPTPGIIKQLDDVQNEVSVLQAGLPCKRGVPDENG